MVGRSRRSDIRVGHNATMPYISSQHFRVYHSIKWPEPGVGAAGDANAMPSLQAWLEDLSQNGTFINGTLVGRGRAQALHDGDKIEMVFPQGRSSTTLQNQNSFPIFTFLEHKPSYPTRAATPLSAIVPPEVGTPQQAHAVSYTHLTLPTILVV